VTLAQRLLVATFVLTVVTTLALGFGVREAWRSAEEGRFQQQFQGAVKRLGAELEDDVRELPALLRPLCDHDPVLDAALVSLRTGTLDSGERLQLSLRAAELRKAFRLDELLLVTGRGEVLGGGAVGSIDAKLAAEIKKDDRLARVQNEAGKVAIVAHCSRSSGGVTLGILGGRAFQSVLKHVGDSQGLELSLDAPAKSSRSLVDSVQLEQLPGVTIYASLSRVPLLAAIGRLERAVLLLGAASLAGALALAWFLSRGLAEPIVSLAEQARHVVTGKPVAIRGRGGRELVQLAESFNHAIADLAALRKRLAATERIAARREIARQVAHEIKNPLAPIRAAVETLRRLRARSDPAFEEYFDEATRTVLGEVARISSIVQEFTRFARLPAPAPLPMNLGQTLREVVGLHAASGTRIDLHVDPVPEIVADRDQMVQVITNLLQNAMDAVDKPPGGLVSLALSAAEPGRVRLSVRDNGPGLAPEMRARLFEPYATTKPEGTGLGLAIVERIVVEHGGEISYRDAEGGGAEFIVELPVSGPTLLPDAPPESGASGENVD
jgi:signal transduction histidine kinase